jgi:cytochrome c oxidase subunit IV
MNNQSNSNINYRRKKGREEMRMQVITFALMIFLTLVAFFAVEFGFPASFVVPFILLLAVIQVIFQFYYFMHAKHKGHEFPMGFMYSAIFTALVMILALVTIVWW